MSIFDPNEFEITYKQLAHPECWREGCDHVEAYIEVRSPNNVVAFMSHTAEYKALANILRKFDHPVIEGMKKVSVEETCDACEEHYIMQSMISKISSRATNCRHNK